MRFATYEMRDTTADTSAAAAGVVSEDGIHPLPLGTTVLDLVRAGLPAALEAGAAARGEPAVSLGDIRLLLPLQPPAIRDFVAFEEHVEGVIASVGEGSGVAPEWYEADLPPVRPARPRPRTRKRTP